MGLEVGGERLELEGGGEGLEVRDSNVPNL
jgi:hypothetical protein